MFVERHVAAGGEVADRAVEMGRAGEVQQCTRILAPWYHDHVQPTMLHTQKTNTTTTYDTIRDTILTCARKLTPVSLIYRTEPTTKKCKTEKLKSKMWLC